MIIPSEKINQSVKDLVSLLIQQTETCDGIPDIKTIEITGWKNYGEFDGEVVLPNIKIEFYPYPTNIQSHEKEEREKE